MRAAFEAIWLRLLGIAALGLTFAAISELWFYPVDLTPDLWMFVVLYGLSGWSAVALIAWAGRMDRAGWWLAGGWIGLLAEGLLVGELYAVPGFNIIWTSLAWHALVTVHVGFVWMRPALAQPRRAATMCAGLGLALGLWNGWMWHVPDKGAAFDWNDPGRFLLQVWIGWVWFLAGHWLWSHVAMNRLSLKWDALILTGFWALIWAAGWALPAFPTSLTLPVLCGLTALALFRRAPPEAKPLAFPRPHRAGLLATAMVPTSASTSFLLVWAFQIEWEANAVAILLLGPISVWFWGRALLQPLVRRSATD